MEKNLTAQDIARMIDISAVRAESTKEEVDMVIDAALENKFIALFALPGLTPYALERIKHQSEVMAGGVVGFPSGGETTSAKVFQAKEMSAMGCGEIDMVINVGKLKSGLYEEVAEDIMAVKEAVAPKPLKVIIEVALLTDQEIAKASEIVTESGVAFLKTGTGWAGSTTFDHLKIINNVCQGRIAVKVAGGVRDLDTLLAMHKIGVTRFGIGHKAAKEIIKEAQERYGK